MAGKARGAALRSHSRRERGPVTACTGRRPPRSHGASFPAEPGLAPEGLRGCGAGLTLVGAVRPTGKGQGKRGSVGEGQSPSSGQKKTVQAALKEGPQWHSAARWEIPAGGWLCHRERNRAGPDRSPFGPSITGLSLRLPGTSVWRGLHVLWLSPVRGGTGAVDLDAETPQLQVGGEGQRLKATWQAGVWETGSSKAPLPSFKSRDGGKG